MFGDKRATYLRVCVLFTNIQCFVFLFSINAQLNFPVSLMVKHGHVYELSPM